MTPGIYDTETLSGFSYVEGKVIQGLHNYRMNLAYRRLPASGFVGGGLKDLTIYDMRNTLEKENGNLLKCYGLTYMLRTVLSMFCFRNTNLDLDDLFSILEM